MTSDIKLTASWVRHPDTPYVPEPSEPVEPDVPSFPFYDVPTSAWYYTAVKYVYDNKERPCLRRPVREMRVYPLARRADRPA